MNNKYALVIIDVQNDFIAGGALAVPEGEKIIPVINQYISVFTKRHLPIIATRDWHPPKTRHFKQYGGLWPPHCIQNTLGAQFHPDLQLPANTIIISAGITEEQQGYSGFEGVDHSGKSLEEVLQSMQITRLFACGLATDYCVKMTVVQALKLGFQVDLLTDAIKGINLQPTDSQKAINEMAELGAKLTTINTLSI